MRRDVATPVATFTERTLAERPVQAFAALRHGIYAKGPLTSEDQKALQQRQDAYAAAVQPTSPIDRDIVRRLAARQHRLERLNDVRTKLVAGAVEKAADNYPEPIRVMSGELRNQQIETAVLEKLVNRLRSVSKGRRNRKNFLRATAPVLDLLLHWTVPVAETPAEDVLPRAVETLAAKKEAMTRTTQRLTALVRDHETAIEAAQASASLLEPGLAEQLRKEMTSEERGFRQDFELLGRRMGEGVLAERLLLLERFSGTAAPQGTPLDPRNPMEDLP
jgi:hypothetical protein